ncbi:MAG TPA: hypothetical protein VMM60_02355 [Ilumatobacter sp.]|nr:hypothetical protein [Ilumatobacter sp.]
MVTYQDIVTAVAATPFVVRGGFLVDTDTADTDAADTVPLTNGMPTRSVVIIGNVGGSIWPRFIAERTAGPDPLDRWTRELLWPIAAGLGASFVHPSDEPFQPFQRWAQRADDVWQSPIGLLIHGEHGLWHAYRGAFLFGHAIADLPAVGQGVSPCVGCADQPCLSTCPVDAFGVSDSGELSYEAATCRSHVASSAAPQCLSAGCAARCACPVNAHGRYERDQMEFHMAAFVGLATNAESE